MKTMSNKQIETGFENLKKEFEIEIKLYQGTATIEDVDFIESLIVGELPAPRSQYLLGLSYYLGVGREYNPEKGKGNYSAYKRFMNLLEFEEVDSNVGKMRIAYKKVISAYDKERKVILTKPVYSCYFEK